MTRLSDVLDWLTVKLWTLFGRPVCSTCRYPLTDDGNCEACLDRWLDEQGNAAMYGGEVGW